MTDTPSPYDALLTQMGEILDFVDSQSSFDNAEAKKMFHECARRIHLGTVPDPLYRMETRPPAIDEAIADATTFGSGFLHIFHRQDDKLVWERLDPTNVVLMKEKKT